MTYRFSPDEVRLDTAVFGPALQRVRAALGVSQKELGRHAVVAPSTIATYETGARDLSPEALVGVLVACGVEPWSAAQHCRLLAAETALQTDPHGVPIIKQLGRRGASAVPVAAPLTLAVPMAITLGAAVVATAVRDRRRQAQQLEMLDQKLLTKALAASPVPQAEERGRYALVETPPRSSLLRHLKRVADDLSDDELMAVIAAIHTRQVTAHDEEEAPTN